MCEDRKIRACVEKQSYYFYSYLCLKKYLKLNTGIPYAALNPNKCFDIGWFFSSYC